MKPPKPPKTITLKFCTVCGRHDRNNPFVGKAHYVGGQLCSNENIVTLEYDWVHAKRLP